MEKFICDRRVKWRTACNSETSGSAGFVRRRKWAGTSAAPATGGGNCVTAPRPGLLNSNIKGSRVLSCIISLLSRRSRGAHYISQRRCIRGDVGIEFGFCRANQQRMAQFRIALAKIQAAQDSSPRQVRQNRRGRAIQKQYGLVKMRRRESAFHTRHFIQGADQIVSSLHAGLRNR